MRLEHFIKDERGEGLQSVVAGIALSAIVVAIAAPQLIDGMGSLFFAGDAEIHDKVRTAAYEYADQNSASVSATVASAAAEITVDTLVTEGFLASEEVESSGTRSEVYNGAGARHITLVRSNGNGLNLITYQLGGTPMSELEVADQLAVLGPSGGLVETGTTNCGPGVTLCARGINWFINFDDFDNVSTNSVLPSGGEVLTFDYLGEGQIVGGELYRGAVNGRPELNSMATDLSGGTTHDARDFAEYRPTGTADGAGLDATRMATLMQLSSDHASGAAATTATASTLALRDVNGNIEAATPTAENHVATKEYVDAAGSGGGSNCSNDHLPGEYCEDGSLFIGYNYYAKGIYIDVDNGLQIASNDDPSTAQLDAMFGVYLGTGTFSGGPDCSDTNDYDRAVFCSDGYAASMFWSDLTPINLSKTCLNRESHGYDDWYLPSYDEMQRLLLINPSIKFITWPRTHHLLTSSVYRPRSSDENYTRQYVVDKSTVAITAVPSDITFEFFCIRRDR